MPMVKIVVRAALPLAARARPHHSLPLISSALSSSLSRASLFFVLHRLVRSRGSSRASMSSIDQSMGVFRFHQYQVVGQALPTPSDEHPKIFPMKLLATNEVRAKSKFWYFLRKLKKVKKSNGASACH